MIKLNSKKVHLLYRLYTEKIPLGTLKDIAIFLEGSNWNSKTHDFLSDCVRISILVYEAEVREEGRERYHPIYKVNKENIIKFWTARAEYKLSEKIIEDEHTIVY